jgi:hypothetical protein
MTNTEYTEAVFELMQQTSGEFVPFVLPNEDGDCVEFFVSPKNYYAKRIDDYLTLYLDEDTEDIAGFVVKNISRILRQVATKQAAYSFVIQDGQIRLEALFAAMFSGDEQRIHFVREYHRVADIAKQNRLDKVQIPSVMEKTPVPRVAETLGV